MPLTSIERGREFQLAASPEEQGEERTGAWRPHLDAGLAKSSREKVCANIIQAKIFVFTFGMFSFVLRYGHYTQVVFLFMSAYIV